MTGIGIGQAFHPGGFLRLRRPAVPQARRQAAHSHRRRQSRHLLALGHRAHRRRSAEDGLGELRHRARRQPQEPAVEHRPVRQQHLLHHDADQLRGRAGRCWPSSRRSRRRTSAASRTTTTSTAAKVFAKANPSKALSYGDAAKRAIALGGKFDGHELPKDINPMTQASATALAGQGLIGVAKDNLPVARSTRGLRRLFHRDRARPRNRHASHRRPGVGGRLRHGDSPAWVSPRRSRAARCRASAWRTLERLVFDPQNGLPANVGLPPAEAA